MGSAVSWTYGTPRSQHHESLYNLGYNHDSHQSSHQISHQIQYLQQQFRSKTWTEFKVVMLTWLDSLLHNGHEWKLNGLKDRGVSQSRGL